MSFRPCNTKRIVPLTIKNVRGDTVSFPGGVDRLIRPVLQVALTRAQRKTGYVIEDKESWGYSCRKIAGTNAWSQHAYGTAIDINAPENARGTRGNIPKRFVRTMKFWGFAWGGDWAYTDPMHFEWRYSFSRLKREARHARRARR